VRLVGGNDSEQTQPNAPMQLPPLRQFLVTVISPDEDGYPQETEVEILAHAFGMGNNGGLLFNEYCVADEPAHLAMAERPGQPVVVERVVRAFAKGAWGGFREVYIRPSVIATPTGRAN
jgi:hypothetical protein